MPRPMRTFGALQPVGLYHSDYNTFACVYQNDTLLSRCTVKYLTHKYSFHGLNLFA
jgi:hypothetical protein